MLTAQANVSITVINISILALLPAWHWFEVIDLCIHTVCVCLSVNFEMKELVSDCVCGSLRGRLNEWQHSCMCLSTGASVPILRQLLCSTHSPSHRQSSLSYLSLSSN